MNLLFLPVSRVTAIKHLKVETHVSGFSPDGRAMRQSE